MVNKFPKICEGSIVMEPRQQVFPRGVYKKSDFSRGSSGKPSPKGSKISNLVNRGVWIFFGTARILPPPPHDLVVVSTTRSSQLVARSSQLAAHNSQLRQLAAPATRSSVHNGGRNLNCFLGTTCDLRVVTGYVIYDHYS
jgi:hypothetical protein